MKQLLILQQTILTTYDEHFNFLLNDNGSE